MGVPVFMWREDRKYTNLIALEWLMHWNFLVHRYRFKFVGGAHFSFESFGQTFFCHAAVVEIVPDDVRAMPRLVHP